MTIRKQKKENWIKKYKVALEIEYNNFIDEDEMTLEEYINNERELYKKS